MKSIIEGLFSACIPLGALIGVVFSNYFLCKFSRRNSVLISDGIGIIFSLLAIIQNFYTFTIHRIGIGIVNLFFIFFMT